jgi:hypothetical protein
MVRPASGVSSEPHFYGVRVACPNFDISGGFVTVTTVSHMSALGVHLSDLESANISGGTITVSGLGPISMKESFFGGILVNHGVKPVINLSGGTIKANTDSGQVLGILQMQSKEKGVLNFSGGVVEVKNSGKGAIDSAVGYLADIVNIMGGVTYVEGENAIGAAASGDLKIGDDAIIFVKGDNAQQYFLYGGATSIVSNKYVNTQLTTLTGYDKNIAVGASLLLLPTYAPTERAWNSFIWKSSDAGVARVEPNGKIVGIANGIATITATARDYTGLSANFVISVGTGSQAALLASGSGSPTSGSPATGDDTNPLTLLVLCSVVLAVVIVATAARRKSYK